MKSLLPAVCHQARVFFSCLLLFAFQKAVAQHDNCTSAQAIAISNGGYGVGTFSSTPVSITNAAVESGETFAPAVLVAGQTQKSVWFKFTLPTTRSVRVTLGQDGQIITAGDVGFTVYNTATCLPANTQISQKLTPITLFGNTYHPCVEAGDYLVQVSGKASAAGNVVVQVETAMPTATYDRPAQAYDFGTLPVGQRVITYGVDCHSLDDAAEICAPLASAARYNKSSWHVFKTPAYFDVLSVFLAQQTNSGIFKAGYKLYQGDVRTNAYTTLPVVDGCDSVQAAGYNAARWVYSCSQLLPNTTYSIQLLFHETFNDNVKLCLSLLGLAPTQAPEPILSGIPSPTNALGTLPSSAGSITTTKTDYLACNARHSLHPCWPSLPAGGATITVNGFRYNMSTFFTFTLSSAADLNISSGISTCSNGPLFLRLYSQTVSNNCTTLDTANIIAKAAGSLNNLSCLPAGQYTLQVMGIDSAYTTSWNYNSFGNSSSPVCVRYQLGSPVSVSFNVRSIKGLNNFALQPAGAFDGINNVSGILQPLVANVPYTSQRDTFGCSNTIRPSDTTCAPGNNKAIYRQFKVADSSLLNFSSTNYLWSKLYRGDADAQAQAQAQGIAAYPGRITGLTPYSPCIWTANCDNSRVCVVPGTYTHATFGNDNNRGDWAQANFKVTPVTTVHHSLATAEDMGDVLSQVPISGGSLQSGVDYYSCRDNAVAINGYAPCTINGTAATKAIYRQFYLSAPAIVSIHNYSPSVCGGSSYKGPMTLFSGKATDGEAGLTPMPSPWRCFTSASINGQCASLPAGWYTVVSYGSGSSYSNPMQSPSYNYAGESERITVQITKSPKPLNNFALQLPGAFDPINRVGATVQPLANNVTYASQRDTFGCGNTVRPFDTTCAPNNNKVVYRQFAVADSGIVSIANNSFWNKLYRGDANSLAVSQNAHSFPARITGLTPYTKCIAGSECDGGQKVCVVPGTYSHLTFGGDGQVGQVSQPGYRFNVVNTTYATPATAEDMGTLNPGGTLTSNLDYFSCKDNAIAINGYVPCAFNGVPATKAIYRQFYLSATSTLSISGNHSTACGYGTNGYMTLFRGKITDGVTGLTPVAAPFRCFQSASTSGCNVFEPGWYTVIAYASGPTYADPFQNLDQNGYGSYIGRSSRVTVSAVAGCAAPKYNRPHKAAVDGATGQPFLIQWGPRAGHTTAYPKTDTTYTLPIENFNCTIDTPFAAHPIPACNASLTKVAYYVFRTTQESFIRIDTRNYWGAVYAGNARTDSASFATAAPIQSCLQSEGFIQICKLQPGSYTLAVFATTAQICNSVQPTIYIDAVGTSRFDYAANAYDFGVVPPDSLYHSGKPGEANPLDAGRAASNDFIYCTTGASANNPAEPRCGTALNNNVYPVRNNAEQFTSSMSLTPQRRNLWYTFVANQGGYVRIRVTNKTPGKTGYQPQYAVYRSNVDGNLSFADVIAGGQVDSTQAQGLQFIVRNNNGSYCYNGSADVNFYRDPCNVKPERYYILVENPATWPIDYSGQHPNAQVEVSILVDSINSIQPKFDHYFQASNIGSNLGVGTYTGATDNYSCATKDATDPTASTGYGSCANKTLWYKFTTSLSGQVRYRVMINGSSQWHYSYVQLFRQTAPNDSTINGMQMLNTGQSSVSDGGFAWGQTCISPGTYYLILTGCNAFNEYVYPVVKLVEQAGDFCSAPLPAPLNGPGTNTATLTVDCHTIGTDYGEFNPTLTCPNGAPKGQYKTSWFRIDITGTDTLDVTTYIVENTNALPADIKYRMMKGNCGAMQEQSCVQDALTQDTYKCLSPGSYFVQVFTPVNKGNTPVTGTISLNLSAVKHADTCAPENKCLSSAAFIPQYDCATGEYVTFNNFSTYGSAIQYHWDFGYNGQTSNAVSPVFKYPELQTPQTYTVTLTATNTGCGSSGNSSTVTRDITIPARPATALPNDTSLCNPNATLLLNATTWPGATYQWQNGSTSPTFTVTAAGTNTYWVKVTYNGCVKRDTIVVNKNPNTRLLQTKYLCGNDSVLLNSTRSVVDSYLWNTGQTTASIYASTGGTYINDVSWKGCVVKDTFNVLEAVEPWTKADTTICFPFKSFTLNAATPGAQSYTWQNGAGGATQNVTAPGIYWVSTWNGTCYKRDTITVVTSAPPKDTVITASQCSGQGYVLPWGQTVSASGTYRDTLRYASGCDSLRRTVNVTLAGNAATAASSATVCNGQPYTLPWGTVVTVSGTYRDTLKSVSGCDSLVRIVTLSIKSLTVTNSSAGICASQTYALPWGTVVSAPGTYSDTLRYPAGCDSLIRTVTLTVKPVTMQNTTASVCSGQPYALPWGASVTAAGVYRDTVRYTSGCDSLIRSVTLRVDATLNQSSSDGICNGRNYTLPWGAVVSVPGIYRDTVRYAASGCDSLVRTVSLTLQSSATSNSNPVICAGQTYTLPWGQAVSASGLYRDTLRYTTGCDSVVRQVNLTVKNLFLSNSTVRICSGSGYTLPWGATVSTAGIYRDTIRYATGCDSLIRTVDLRVTAPAVSEAKPVICSNQTFTLPWGPVVNASGLYSDTLRSAAGCDSLVRTVRLTVNPQPAVRLSKSNDVDCTLGTTKLSATGGQKYLWSPATGLSDPAIANPVASPAASTMYKVTVTSGNGCVKEDSIYVTVAIGNPEAGYPVASAFTPNGDGLNDCFGISNWGDVKDLEFSVFNRWGQLVFYTADKNRCWNGKVADVPQKTDVYVYIIKAKTVCGPVFRKGTVALVR